MKTKQGAPAWPIVIEQLTADRAAAAAEGQAAAQEAGSVSLAASMGDKSAVARLAAADAQEAAAGRRVKQLDAALADAEGQLRAVEQMAVDAATAERRAALATAAVMQVEMAGEVDRAAAVLARAMGAYDGHLLTLARLGLDTSQYNQLRNRTMLAGSLHLAGLSGKIPLAACSPHHRRPLRDWSAARLADLLHAPASPAGGSAEPILVEAVA